MKNSFEPHDEKIQEDPEDCPGYGTPTEEDEVEGDDGHLAYLGEVDDYSSFNNVPL